MISYSVEMFPLMMGVTLEVHDLGRFWPHLPFCTWMSRCWKCWVKGFYLISEWVKEPQIIPCISRLIKKNTLILTTDPKFQRDILVIPTNGLINETQKILFGVFWPLFWGWRFVASIPRVFFLKTGGTRFQLAIPFQDPPTRKTSLMQRARGRNRLSERFFLFLVRKRGTKMKKQPR